MASLKYRVQQIRAKFQLTVGAALLLSIYAYYVEWKHRTDSLHKFLCDISDGVSCTKAFNSQYGKGLGIVQHIFGEESFINQPNSVYGIIACILQLVLDEVNSEAWASYKKSNFIENYVMAITFVIAKCQFAMSIVANCCSVYLAYILAFKLHNMCVVCVTMYVLNAYVLYCNYHKLQLLKQIALKRQQISREAYSFFEFTRPK